MDSHAVLHNIITPSQGQLCFGDILAGRICQVLLDIAQTPGERYLAAVPPLQGVVN